MRVLLLVCIGLFFSVSARAAEMVALPFVKIHKDFTTDFDSTLVKNSSAAEASMTQRSGKVTIPGIFLHPQAVDDAIVAYPKVKVPEKAADIEVFLVFRIGLRDGIRWEEKTANGVRFSVVIDGERVFSDDCVGIGWQPRAVDLAPWAGKEVTFELHTNAIDGNTAYDWAVFGEPLLVTVNGVRVPATDAKAVGLALMEITCSEPSTVSLAVGGDRITTSLGAGPHWIPVNFAQYHAPEIQVEKGAATLTKTIAGLFDAELTPPELSLSSPLVTVGHPFTVILQTKNIGRGTYARGEKIALEGLSPDDFGSGVSQVFELPRLAPGETGTLRWTGLTVAKSGYFEAKADGFALPFHAFGPESEASSHETVFGPKFARLRIVFEDDDAYGIAEALDVTKHKWRRVGSVYPFMSASVGGRPVRLKFQPPQQETVLAKLMISAYSEQTGIGCSVYMEYFLFYKGLDPPDDNMMPSQIMVTADLVANEESSISSFSGPALLAGDRAFGTKKDFAIFPGLEYLEGDEASSSERDLAPPLNDRQVPLPYKMTIPLMAVEGNDTLMALLWDEKQKWLEGERYPAARFLAPKRDTGYEFTHMSLFAPSVGKYVKENTCLAQREPLVLRKMQSIRLRSSLIFEHKSLCPETRKGSLALRAIQHWFDLYGGAYADNPRSMLPGEGRGITYPSHQPRDWDTERALCRDAYLHAIWTEDPPGWSHCVGWQGGPNVGHIVPLTLDLEWPGFSKTGSMSDTDRSEVQRRIDLVLGRALKEQGKHFLWSNAACHIMLAELPFTYGYLAESLADFRNSGLALIAARENGKWVWHPHDEQTATLGKDGDDTLGQASYPSYMALRAARMTGDPELAAKALDAMKQMEKYDVPRGAQVWECPLYQPDILAAAQAIRAYCEAFRITGDTKYVDQARYWAWTGLPFLYMWDMDGYPTMRYNAVSVFGSTFYTHSWIGLPVVWCGLVYAYAVQDLAEFDKSFDWPKIAQGITNSAMWQQYTDGPSKGCYPDSWSMERNKPNPSDINPENILVNEFRLRGFSPEIRCARLEIDGKNVMLNSFADLSDAAFEKETETVRFTLTAKPERAGFSILAQVPEPREVTGTGARVADSDALQAAPEGWIYDTGLKAVIVKTGSKGVRVKLP